MSLLRQLPRYHHARPPLDIKFHCFDIRFIGRECRQFRMKWLSMYRLRDVIYIHLMFKAMILFIISSPKSIARQIHHTPAATSACKFKYWQLPQFLFHKNIRQIRPTSMPYGSVVTPSAFPNHSYCFRDVRITFVP